MKDPFKFLQADEKTSIYAVATSAGGGLANLIGVFYFYSIGSMLFILSGFFVLLTAYVLWPRLRMWGKPKAQKVGDDKAVSEDEYRIELTPTRLARFTYAVSAEVYAPDGSRVSGTGAGHNSSPEEAWRLAEMRAKLQVKAHAKRTNHMNSPKRIITVKAVNE